MSDKRFSSEFLAAQIAGSCRLEGIHISAEQEQMMRDIIDGKLDSQVLIRQMIAKHKVNNPESFSDKS